MSERKYNIPVHLDHKFWSDLDAAKYAAGVQSYEYRCPIYIYRAGRDHYPEYWLLRRAEIITPESEFVLGYADGHRLHMKFEENQIPKMK